MNIFHHFNILLFYNKSLRLLFKLWIKHHQGALSFTEKSCGLHSAVWTEAEPASLLPCDSARPHALSSPGNRARGPLTLIANEESHAGPAVVCAEQEVHEVARADEELGRLRAVVLPDQRGRAGRPVSDLQRVVVDFGLESAGKCVQWEEKCRAAMTYRHPVSLLTEWKPTYSKRSKQIQIHMPFQTLAHVVSKVITNFCSPPQPSRWLNTLSSNITDTNGAGGVIQL